MENNIQQAPNSTDSLIENAQALAGLTLGELARKLGKSVPTTLLQSKGWIGETLEAALGATAGSRPVPDFESLGIELKTIPVNFQGHPQESTFVCTAPLSGNQSYIWEASVVRLKLSHVLWVPILTLKNLPLQDRVIGMPILWKPDKNIKMQLKQDWEELMDALHLGQVEALTAKLGVYLQIRPKAANSKVRCLGMNEEGETITTVPKGFYLRSSFTRKILKENYILAR